MIKAESFSSIYGNTETIQVQSDMNTNFAFTAITLSPKSTPQSTNIQIQSIVYSRPSQQIPEEMAVTLKFYHPGYPVPHPELLDVTPLTEVEQKSKISFLTSLMSSPDLILLFRNLSKMKTLS